MYSAWFLVHVQVRVSTCVHACLFHKMDVCSAKVDVCSAKVDVCSTKVEVDQLNSMFFD